MYLSGILRNDVGTPGASETSKIRCISSERLQVNVMSMYCVEIRQRNDALLMILGRFLPPCLLRVFGSDVRAPLDDKMALILQFARTSQDLRLEGGDIAIKFLQVGKKRARLGFFAGFVVDKG